MINNILAVIIVLATLLFGAVEVWSSAAILILVFAAGVIWSITEVSMKRDLPADTGRLFLAALVFCCYIGLQLIPLPAAVVSFISPATARTRDFYSFSGMQFMQLSIDPYLTIHELLRAAAFFTVYFISSSIFRDREKLTRMIIMLIVFGFCLAVFAIVQKATWNEKIYWFRELSSGGVAFGPFANRNHFAGMIGMLIPLGLGYTLTRESRDKIIFFGFLTVIMTVSLFFSLSRGGIISFVASMALFSILMVVSRIQTRRIWVVAGFLTVVAAYLLYLGIDPVIDRFYQTDVSKEQRLIVWQSTLSAYKDFWLTGSGLGTFIDVFNLYSPAAVKSIFDHAHNDYLEFMVETGAIGMALFVTFSGLLLAPLAKTNFQGKRGMIRIALIASILSIMMHSIFDFNLHILSNLLLFAVVLGMLSSLIVEDKYHKRKRKGNNEPEGNGIEPSAFPAIEIEDWEKDMKKQ